MFPNTNKLGYSYPLIGVDEVEKTITVKGDVSPVYEYVSPPSPFAFMYGQYIKDTLNNLPVKFFDQTGKNSFADGDTTYDGVCEVCHTQTSHFRNDGGSLDQNHANVGGAGGTNCSSCHSHMNGLSHGGGEGTACDSCHGKDTDNGGAGTTISHSTHTENDADDLKGPYINCNVCHDTNSYPYFKSGTDTNGDGKYNLSETDVCDTCHSPGGSFNGIISEGASIGAKTNWVDGVYQSDGTLSSGKEKWCAGCHDDVPAVVNNTAPDICGDNSTYGYYIGAHGEVTYGVNRSGISYSRGECVHCHEVSVVNPDHGGELFAVYNPTTQTNNFCFECHKGTGTKQDPVFSNYNYTQRVSGNTYYLFPTNILDFFSYIDESGNPVYNLGYSTGSSHKLTDIKNFLDGRWGYTADSNPCTACHNPHRAERDSHTAGNRGWPVSRPSSHTNDYTWELWGDDPDERMNQYTTYQAPSALDLEISTNATYTIHHDDGSEVVTKDQHLNGGVWVSLGTYPLGHNGADDYVELSQSPNGIVVADAIKYNLVEAWDIIMDNTDATYVGEWTTYSNPVCYGFYGLDYEYSLKGDGSDTATWTPYIPESGDYEVYAMGVSHCYQPYTGYNAPFTVYYDGGSQTKQVDQRTSTYKGKWNLLGTFPFVEGTSGYVVLSDDIDCCGVAADAIQWEKVRPEGLPEEFIVDNPDGTTTGFWQTSDSLPGYYGDNYHYHETGSGADYFRWTLTVAIPGTYEVFVRWIGVHEPDLSAIQDGSNLTDYVTFCTDCHNNSNTIYSNVLKRNLYTIDWTAELHGGGAADSTNDSCDCIHAPYEEAQLGDYILACTDCHEPHGTQNNFLIRPYVNNQWVEITNYGTGYGPYPDSQPNKEWSYLCGRCHDGLAKSDGRHAHIGDIDGDDESDCTSCHGGGTYRNCGECHYHGNDTIDGIYYGKLF